MSLFPDNDMLESYLRKCRIRRCVDPMAMPGSHPAYPVVDTVEIVATEIEPVLIQHSQFDALPTLCQRHGDARKLFELYVKVADGEYQTDQIKDPLKSITTILTVQKDRAVSAVGFVDDQAGTGAGLEAFAVILASGSYDLFLMPARNTGKRREKPEEDLALLEQVTEASKEAGQLFLEYLVLQRRSSIRELRSRLANILVDNLHDSAGDTSTLRLWQAKARSFATSHDVSFLHPNCARSKTGSRPPSSCSGPTFEIAILDGKFGRHQQALKALVHDVRDEVFAEIYCALRRRGGPAEDGAGVKDRGWHVIHERGMLIEKAEDDGNVEGDVVDEKAALAAAGQDVDEHVELGEAGWTEPDTADVHVTV
ncbi:hypothetical protein BD626DRAFT_629965 [Schizophyllum amplum]|uniref:Uncharacterized protein n=1 Tax=Schizophyllum amplum TaxID=97359 RepID=A0A550CF38_9AGAR|nr:hypothetical protein BD626DRAFT_629965 [Auriculariopsis ampla]